MADEPSWACSGAGLHTLSKYHIAGKCWTCHTYVVWLFGFVAAGEFMQEDPSLLDNISGQAWLIQT